MIEHTEHGERTDQTPIERTVMRRVRLIRILTLIISTAVLTALTLVATLWGIGKEVWVARIVENMPHSYDTTKQIGFWFSAFLHTTLIVQILTTLTVVSFLFLIREIARVILGLFQPKNS